MLRMSGVHPRLPLILETVLGYLDSLVLLLDGALAHPGGLLIQGDAVNLGLLLAILVVFLVVQFATNKIYHMLYSLGRQVV